MSGELNKLVVNMDEINAKVIKSQSHVLVTSFENILMFAGDKTYHISCDEHFMRALIMIRNKYLNDEIVYHFNNM